ncbi:DUF4197 domain-containing protein [Sphingopyxis sp. BSN-002]|uniref:DUF4197 domain-containing protein n=1 Tax=Sphingopyxis sp. BSN-002 TaxID=2911495 RepID=UPI001EDA1072|nr:DUF4197 domain-containing protein [Sphingopyxis sp. BSN-002]UKK84197.1 DUF4197 domain-containing protein [Sphingopyxis sp. BSN-002]
MNRDDMVARRHLLAGGAALAGLGLVPAAFAKTAIGGFKGLISGASDNALDRLAQPGAFYADTAVRILLPGASGKLASKLLGAGDKLGLTTKLTKSLNDAGGKAAGEAKPVFRAAIDNLGWNDVPSLVSKKDGATRYLQSSAGGVLTEKVRPLVTGALESVGAYRQLDQLGRNNQLLSLAGVSHDRLTDSVTEQALKGIFLYMGNEEAALRKNPGKLLKGVF